MYGQLFNEFLASSNTLHVYRNTDLIFSSKKDRLVPLLEYIAEFSRNQQQVIIFDKIIGNAAALLAVKAKCREVYSPLGSQISIKTLKKYNVKYNFNKVVPYIQKPDGISMCPMEKLSIDKEPEEFYKEISARMISSNTKQCG